MEYRVARRELDGDKSVRTATYALDELFTDALVRRFQLRAGFTTTCTSATTATREFFHCFLRKLITQIVQHTAHSQRFGILLTDVLHACKQQGIRLYGYDDTCVLNVSGSVQEYHVTEMVEMRMTFNRAPDEPDHEPTGRYQKTDYVANQVAWDADDEGWSSGDEDDTSDWYGDSDADSDSDESDNGDDELEDIDVEDEPEADLENEQGSDVADQEGKTRKRSSREQFFESLREAQHIVDEQLLIKEPDMELDECDAPMGQGSFSDDEMGQDWEAEVQDEDSHWQSRGTIMDYSYKGHRGAPQDDGAEPQDAEQDCFEDGNVYIISRRWFAEIVHREMIDTMRRSLPISTVALSALHNVCEQYLHKAMTDGVLKTKVVALLMENELEVSMAARSDLAVAQEKLYEVEHEKQALVATFQAKELQMKQRIAELEHRLRKQQASDPASEPTSPRKRKALQQIDENANYDIGSTSGSLASSLKSRLHGLRKKKSKLAPP